MRRCKRAGAALLALCLLLPALCLGEGSWYSFPLSAPPENAGFRVCEYTGDVRVTFLGDCTLGGEEKRSGASYSFFKQIEKNGFDFPFRELTRLTAQDDLTVANLEGVLSDRELPRTEKEFNFIGPTAYTEILQLGSVECVTLANNHSHDYGDGGYADTQAALDRAGITWFSADNMAMWESPEGLRIGFLGVSYSLNGSRATRYQHQAELLRNLGCGAVITVMHAGTERQYTPDSYQKQIVARATEAGCDLVVGHHPHVVQGWELTGDTPVVYSLGNCVFGGNAAPKDTDALALQAVLSFEEGDLTAVELHFYPISVTSSDRANNYSPRFLEGADAERVLTKMRESTGTDPGVFSPENGAAVRIMR